MLPTSSASIFVGERNVWNIQSRMWQTPREAEAEGARDQERQEGLRCPGCVTATGLLCVSRPWACLAQQGAKWYSKWRATSRLPPVLREAAYSLRIQTGLEAINLGRLLSGSFCFQQTMSSSAALAATLPELQRRKSSSWNRQTTLSLRSEALLLLLLEASCKTCAFLPLLEKSVQFQNKTTRGGWVLHGEERFPENGPFGKGFGASAATSTAKKRNHNLKKFLKIFKKPFFCYFWKQFQHELIFSKQHSEFPTAYAMHCTS